MSIELPEAFILANQLNKEIIDKQISSYELKDYERLQKIGFLNKDIEDFDMLLERKVKSVISRGNLILIRLDSENNILIGPEYGGKLIYHKNGKKLPEKFHMKITFTDDTILTLRLTGMGAIITAKDSDLEHSYLYQRDFSDVLSPLDKTFTFDHFSNQLSSMKRGLKSLLVGKDALLVGLSNSAFQDIIYRAKLFPKMKGSSLNEQQKKALYDSIKILVNDRITLGGKYQFVDLYGKKGQYLPAMGPNMKGKVCSVCNSAIEKMSIGGGQIYYCPQCQKE